MNLKYNGFVTKNIDESRNDDHKWNFEDNYSLIDIKALIFSVSFYIYKRI